MTYQEILNAVNELLQESVRVSEKFSTRYAHILESNGKFAIPIDELRGIDYALYENTLMLNLLLKRLIQSKEISDA